MYGESLTQFKVCAYSNERRPRSLRPYEQRACRDNRTNLDSLCFRIRKHTIPMQLGPSGSASRSASCSSTHHWARTIVLYIIGLLLQVVAQEPITSFGGSQVVVQGKAMVISGGISSSQGVLSQTFAIDLTIPWAVSNPKYSILADGPADLYVPFGQAADGSLIVISRAQSFSFGLDSPGSWIMAGNIPNGYNAAMTRLTGAIDPATNVFYLPGGFQVAGANYTMMRYSIAQRTSTSLPMPSTLLSYAESTAVWSAYAKRLFLHGGRSQTSFSPLGDLYSFNPVDSSWSLPKIGGSIPPKRYNHCMAADATGKRLVVFGGFDSVAVPALSDIYILDVETMQWTKGPEAGNAVARAAPSCGIDHDFFIVWGGGSNSLAVSTNVTLLFNLQTMQWVDKFTPAASTPSSVNDTSSKSLSIGAIIGGTVGGLAVITAALGLTMYKRRKSQEPPISLQKEEVLEVSHNPPDYEAPPSPPLPPFQHQCYHDQLSNQQQPDSTPVLHASEPLQYRGPQSYDHANEENINLPFHSMGYVGPSAPTIETLRRWPEFKSNPTVNGPHAIVP